MLCQMLRPQCADPCLWIITPFRDNKSVNQDSSPFPIELQSDFNRVHPMYLIGLKLGFGMPLDATCIVECGQQGFFGYTLGGLPLEHN